MPSKNDDKELIKVFFYGTLKRGQPNDEHLYKNNVTFIGEATTVEKWPLIITSDINMPFLLNSMGDGKYVKGEMYLIDHEAKRFFDWFEGIEDDLYTVIELDVKESKSGHVHRVLTYVLDNFRKDIINETTIFFEEYSSVNDHHGEYKKVEDTPENVQNLLRQIKHI